MAGRFDSLPRIREQHVGVRPALVSLEARLDDAARAERDGRGDDATRDELIERLADLEGHLVRHFALEEESGYLAEVVDYAPRHARRAAALEQQHAGLREAIATLSARSRAAGPAAREWSDLALEFRQFAADLLAHEEAENEIIADALIRDQGGG